MVTTPRKKSPRAPTMALDDALEKAMKAYDKERLHPAPTDVVAQNIGYKGSSNGSALAAMASLRYYGLLERPGEGLLAVSKDVEAFHYAPSEQLKRSILLSFLLRPALFAELLDKYSSGLPSDANLKYELIQRGFLPGTASSVVTVFRRSVEFSGYFDGPPEEVFNAPTSSDKAIEGEAASTPAEASQPAAERGMALANKPTTSRDPTILMEEVEHDRIPVRLSGGRRAWLTIPSPFFAADKLRLKAQIDLLLTEEDEACN